jgi:hypothetical protein
MARGAGAAGGPLTWVLALGLAAALDAAITRTPVLWAPTAFETTRDMSRVAFAQSYQAARTLYAPEPAARRVVVLGNSRAYLGARPALVEAELQRLGVDPGVRVDSLAIFGAGLGDEEVVARHVPRLRPALVVLTLGASDLEDTPALPLAGTPAHLLDVGWADGPLPPPDAAARLERWGRTVWPLFRFREFARAALADRLVPGPADPPLPDRFADMHAVFAYMQRGADPSPVDAAWAAWRAAPSLRTFVAYLERESPANLALVRSRTRDERVPADAAAPGRRVLDALLDRLAALPAPALVVLMPENPILAEDAAGEYHRPGVSDAVAGLVVAAAARDGVRVVDARTWLPAEAFLDFDHPIPDLGGFHRPFARVIADALAS